MAKKPKKSNCWCVEVGDVSWKVEIVKVIEKCHGYEYDIIRRSEVYKDEEELEEIVYVYKETYHNDLKVKIGEKKGKDGIEYRILLK